jgi:AcrR family transcriptional regulator
VRICDADGIASLTIRKIAAELGIGTMTLYGYYRSKDEILDAIADHILGTLEVPEPDDETPAAMVRSVAKALFAMMREHPSVVYLLSSRATITGKSLKVAMDDVVGMLRRAGFDGLGAVRAYALAMTYCLGFASYQLPRPWGASDIEEGEELRRQRRAFYMSLPLPDFPNLVELNEPLTTMPSDDQFEFGLECMTLGLLAELERIGHPVGQPPRDGARRRKR